jgi:hypothetical protein
MTAYITGNILWGTNKIEQREEIKSSKKTLDDLKSLLKK